MPMVDGLDEARSRAVEASEANYTDLVPPHFPGGTIAALALLILHQDERIKALEAAVAAAVAAARR